MLVKKEWNTAPIKLEYYIIPKYLCTSCEQIKLKTDQRNIYEGKTWHLSTKSEQLEWRRSKVVEMRARYMSQIEIAHELQVSKQSISSDMQYLRS